jgi:sterol desaturase/sphingolipid hydroxylase (fatty acid hydroxylase superfamily)
MDPANNPVTQRWLLIERLDTYVMWSCGIMLVLTLVVWAFWWKYEKTSKPWRIAWRITEGLGNLFIVALVCYLVWKYCFAWKGIHYP